MKLEGTSALITGASQGLGREIARHFIQEGARVTLCARDAEQLEKTCFDLNQLEPPNHARCKAADVSSESSVAELAAFAGDVDILVCNAGVLGPKGPAETTDWSDWVRTIEINLYGVLLPIRTYLPLMKDRRRGKILILSGGGATAPMANLSAYAASKAAVIRFMETLAIEVKDFGIDVNAIAPGAMNTRFLDEALAAGPEKLGSSYFSRLLQQRQSGGVPPEKGASLAVFLASRDSDGITGKLISAQWDPWPTLAVHKQELASTDIYTLRRIVPEDRGLHWE